jgi:hypothetical protein
MPVGRIIVVIAVFIAVSTVPMVTIIVITFVAIAVIVNERNPWRRWRRDNAPCGLNAKNRHHHETETR